MGPRVSVGWGAVPAALAAAWLAACPGPASAGGVKVVPGGEGTIQLELSDSAINRIRCPEDVSTIIYAKDKPVDIKTRGQDVFIRFTRKASSSSAPSAPSFMAEQPSAKAAEEGLAKVALLRMAPVEMYLYCGDEAYSISLSASADPEPTTVLLKASASGKAKRIQEYEKGLPYEQKIVELVRAAYLETPPSYYELRSVNRQVENYVQGELTKLTEWVGDRYVVASYMFTNTSPSPMNFTEMQFAALERRPLAVSMTQQVVAPGETIRIFVVRSSADGN